MAAPTRTFEDVTDSLLSASNIAKVGIQSTSTTPGQATMIRIMHFWTFTGRVVPAKCLSCFHGDRETAMVLDLACGTGTVASQLKKMGFRHFLVVDWSKGMLELANKTGLSQDLKQCMLGD